MKKNRVLYTFSLINLSGFKIWFINTVSKCYDQ